MKLKNSYILIISALVCCTLFGLLTTRTRAAEDTDSVGLEATITSAPPTQAATITVPRDGQVFTEIPITVSGLCSGDLLVKLFKNNVFGGSVQCKDGSYSLTVDLFSGKNDLVARVYDALDQAGPDSNIVGVTFNDSRGGSVSRPTLTSNYAKRGANPGETLTWPIILSGGTGPYAVSVDWGDGKPSDLFTQAFPGTFDITHIYDQPGVYNIVIRASDSNDSVAFLQLVGIANGPIIQDGKEVVSNTIIVTKVLWWPLFLMLPLLVVAFWLGRRHAIQELRRKFQ